MRALSLTLLILPFLAACATAPLSPEKAADFSTNGFLDASTFQVTAAAAPDASAKGLVAQRESAAVKARGGLQDAAVKALVEYRLARFTAENKGKPDLAALTAEARSMLSAEFRKYLSCGGIAEEYYEKDNSAAIVYRIVKSGLRAEVEGYTITFKEKKTEEKK